MNSNMNQINKTPAKTVEKKGKPFFPNHLLDQMMAVYITLGIVFTLALFYPFDLHDLADPFKVPEVVKPEWYFLGIYQALKYLPLGIGVPLFLLAALALLLWPFIERSKERHPLKRKRTIIIGLSVGLILLLFTLLGYLSESTRIIAGKEYRFSSKGIPHRIERW